MRVLALPAFVIAVLASGCAGTVGYTATVSNDGYYGGPDLVYAAPGVQVIADWNEPIFFADGFYWRYDGFSWYRSSIYTGGWMYATPPMAILSIRAPLTYRHYRPVGWQPRHIDRGPAVRDHRPPPPPARWTPPPPRRMETPPPRRFDPPPPPARQGPPPPPPRDRDHRDRDRDREHRRG